MLVSSIARFEAMNTANNAAFASMQMQNNMLSAVNGSHTFGGENNLNLLHALDQKMSIGLATNSLLYKIATLQEKMFSKMHSEELKRNSIDYIA